MNTNHRKPHPWLNRAVRSVFVTGAIFTFGSLNATAQSPTKAVLLAPEPLKLSTGETGYSVKEPTTPVRTARGASPEPPVAFPTAEDNSGPPLPIPTPTPISQPAAQQPAPTWVVAPNGTVRQQQPTQSWMNTKQRSTSEFGSGWRNVMGRMFGKPTKSPVNPVVQAGPVVPPMAAPNQMAHRWYGYGSPVPQNAPQVAEASLMPSNWYAQTGATPGAMPVNNQMNQMASAPQRPAPKMMSFEEAYGPLNRSPIVQANFDSSTRDQPKVGGAKYVPPGNAVAKEHPRTPQNLEVASAHLEPKRHDLIPPPPLPTVRWQSPNSDAPPSPMMQTGTANANVVASNQQQPVVQQQIAQRPVQQQPLSAQGRENGVNLMAPQPYNGSPPRSANNQPAQSIVQLKQPGYVARGQSDESQQLADQLTKRIQTICGQYIAGVQVQQKSAKLLLVTLIVKQESHAEPIANHISRMPELAAYQVDFEVRIAGR